MNNPNEGVGSLLPAVSRGRLRLLRRLDGAGGHSAFARTQPKTLCAVASPSRAGGAKRAQRRVRCRGPRPAILTAQQPQAFLRQRQQQAATPRSGLVQPSFQRPCHGRAPPRQAVPLCEEAQPRTKPPRHTTINMPPAGP
ncbi:hypothetical protein CBM2623_A40053 [Cupriavidus taiwanensis]|nr:hypothetical protein CBM2608_A30053 [Cupriavidus taiwanensis]SPA29512.1 hypothetical protein CBM2623_A40053 [Cupriavidus taiwanensis]